MTLANMTTDTDPRHNGTKIDHLLQTGAGFADLYRTVTAGPSGQRTRLHVARIWAISLDTFGPDDFRIIDPTSGDTAGFARRDPAHGWSITRQDYAGELRWIGYAPESLAAGCDVLINGVHAATGRHDSRRISTSTWIPNPNL